MGSSVILSRLRQPFTFGGADGTTVLLGLLVSLAGQPHALVRAATGAGLAELVGMTAGAWLSDEKSGFGPALANGAAAFGACLLPALPFTVMTGWPAAGTSVIAVVLVAATVALLRPERGVLAFAQTFGILAAAAVLCWAASLI